MPIKLGATDISAIYLGGVPVTTIYKGVTQVYGSTGPELVTNGDFSSAVGWSVPAGVSITGGAAVCAAGNGYIYRTGLSLTSGVTYRVSFKVSGYSGGTVRGYLQATPVFGSLVSSNGTFSFDLVCTTTNASSEHGLNLSTFYGTIDDFSIKAL